MVSTVKKNALLFVLAIFVSTFSFSQTAKNDSIPVANDSTKLKYNFGKNQTGGIYLGVPSKKTITFDKILNRYVITETIGNYLLKPPVYLTPEQYARYRLENDILDYYKSKIDAEDGKKKGTNDGRKNLLPKYYVNNKFFQTIFGGNEIEITPTGNINLRLGFIYQNTDNPQISEENRSSFTLDFDQQISAGIRAKIGERLQIIADYDTQASFDFQNLIRLEFIPPTLSDVKYSEDGIIQGIEAGNISMPIKNSLINGAQSLFGLKTDLKFGNTNITAVFSQQNSESKVVTAESGAVIEPFELRATDYDTDRHFFLSQYFIDNYAAALRQYPLINSQVSITRVEVWITNRNATTEDFRSIVAFADIAESDSSVIVDDNNQVLDPAITQAQASGGNLPFNGANKIGTEIIASGNIRDIANVETSLNSYAMEQGTDYSILQNARKLDASEFVLNPQLGYISLNRRLNDGEVLAVAYEYTVAGQVTGNTKSSYKVGEFSNDGIQAPNNLVVKLLRSEILTTKRPDGNGGEEPFPTWRLMMKNIYALGAFPLTSEGFRFEVQYRDDQTGIASNTLQNASTLGIPTKPLIQVLNVDQLDQSQVRNADGFFDYVEGITVNSQNGYVIFPEPEPFGENLNNTLTAPSDKEKYVFEELYLNTKINIQNNFQNKDKFLLKGFYKSETASGIPLNAFNVPQGSVKVTAGGRQLVEGVDFVVDYIAGRVQIIDAGLKASGVPIQVAVENNAVFNQQRKTFMGVDVTHKFSDKLLVGGTILNVEERPLTPKVNYGAEPINNTMLGFSVDYATEVPFFTKLANKLPFVDTDVPSNLSVRAEMAYLIPGTPDGIDVTGAATSYIDDFEASQIPISVLSPLQWFNASTPDTPTFPLFNAKSNNISYNDKRAKLAWYNIDQIFYGFGDKPSNIDADEVSRAETRQINYEELFPNVEQDVTQNTLIRTLDLAFFPSERGPYNFDQIGSETLEGDRIQLKDPETRWGGIMRPLTTNNFDQANVEYIQFWVMDPYENYSITPEEGLNTNPNNPANQVGDLYINLGNVSEDINKDNFKMYENGLPKDGNKLLGVNVRQSPLFGVVPFNPSIIYAFDIDEAARLNQDIGLDGLNDTEEAIEIDSKITESIYAGLPDPAADNFQYYRGGNLDAQNASILSRYKDFNNTQGNSPTANQSPEPYPTSSTTYPDVEDINRDQTMNTVESYYEYKISMNKNDLGVGKNFIVDQKVTNVTLENGDAQQTTWYQFRVPVRSGTAINNIADFNSIRFMRMYLTNFKMPVVIRFGELDLVRGDYRRYTNTLNPAITPRPLNSTELGNFEVGVISLEQNDGDYVLPPGIVREQLQGSTTIQQQNEQSVTLKVTNLAQNATRAIYKNISIDLRRSKNLKMFIHAGTAIPGAVGDDDLMAILRLGTDLDENFYQLEIPLKISPDGSLNPLDVWPEANNVDALLEKFGILKLERDDNALPINELYPAPDPSDPKELIIRVKGNPTLAAIRTVMLGVKNTAPTVKSAEIWFNELRAAGFDNEGGWAAVVNADANFADVANVSVSGSMQTVGFGNVEDRISQRSLDETKQYDIATSLDLAKVFTPQNWGLQVPMSYSIGERFIDPKFDRQYQDVEFSEVSSDSLIAISRDYTKRTSISFNNVRKSRNPNSESKPRFYDVENVAVSYAHNQEFHTDYNIEQYINESVTASATYNYNFQSDFIEPFKETKALDGKYYKLIKDFNFNPIPKTVGLNSRVHRNYTEQQSRNLIEGLSKQPKLTQRRFLFDWDYVVGFDLTKSITLNFNATNSYIYDSFGTEEDLQIFDDFFNTGKQNHYHQKLNATYQVPIDKVPYLDFIKADVGYTADFDWQATSQDSSIVAKVGNVVQNANTKNGNLDFNFAKLYKDAKLEELLFTKRKKKVKNSNTENTFLPPTPNRTATQKKKEAIAKKILRAMYGVATSVKTGKLSYAENNGQFLSGYAQGFGFLGGPPTAFAFGSQVDIRNQALTEGWLIDPRDPSNSEYFNKTYRRTHYNKFDYNFNLKPFNDLDITIIGNKIKTRDFSQQLDILEDGTENGRIDDSLGSFSTGNFSTSYSMVSTIFTDSDALFQQLRDNRAIISQRLATETGQDITGFGANSQQVLLPAFLSAYGGENPDNINTGLFRDIPIPNWTLRYNGFMKLKWFKKNFSNFVVTNGYRSSYTISSFTNNLQYNPSNPFAERNANNNYNPELLITAATLVDEFSPLIKVDFKMKSSFSFSGEIKKDRTLTLNFNNSTLTDIQGLEYVFGFGYVLKDVKFNTRFTGKKVKLKGDINFRADISLRDNTTTVRSIDTENDQISGGQKIFSIKFAADYKLSSNLTASFYYNHQTSKYAISTTFPRQAINAGLNIVYNLGQ